MNVLLYVAECNGRRQNSEAGGREQVCMYGLLPVQRGGVLGGSWWQGTMLHEKSMQQAVTMHAKLRHDTVVQQIHAVTR